MLHSALSFYPNELVQSRRTTLKGSWSAFKSFGCIGLVFSMIESAFLSWKLSLSLPIIAELTLVSVLVFIGITLIIKIVTGEEQLIYYHNLVAAVGINNIILRLLNQPILTYLDVVVLCIGLFQACGRIGCLMVGCCYGRPNSWGICYRQEHANAGFPAYLVGVRLFPTQAIESLWGFLIVLVGSLLVLNHQPPGEAFAWYILSYGAARFCLEFFRGDPERPYLWGFSEAQWTSLLLMSAVVWAGAFEVLPFHWWYVGVLGMVILIGFTVTFKRLFQTTDEYHLLHPKHIQEVAEAMELISNLAIDSSPLSTVHIACTSLGIHISASSIKNATSCIDHFTFSSEKEGLTRAKAHVIAQLIMKLKQAYGSAELIERNQGIFHLIIPQNQNTKSGSRNQNQRSSLIQLT